MHDVWVALGLTVFAGMATGIGSVIAFTAKRTNYRFLSVATGFSAGVMLYVSFVEIFLKGAESLAATYGDYWGNWVNAGAFFAGVVFIGIIDTLIPAEENPHETPAESETAPLHDVDIRETGGAELQAAAATTAAGYAAADAAADTPDVAADVEAGGPRGTHSESEAAAPDIPHQKLMRMGLFTALAIAIHNLPEGLATFLAALEDPALGVAIAVAIALHNIPEGISVSVPIFYATGNRKKAFLYSVLSGLAEPVGAGIAYLALRLVVADPDGAFPPQLMGILFSGVAGIMVYISLDELLPTSRAYGKGHDSLYGLFGGMLVMALSLLLMS
ncbi:MAG: zinc transporter ZupT [Spirochaetia bacterium]